MPRSVAAAAVAVALLAAYLPVAVLVLEAFADKGSGLWVEAFSAVTSARRGALFLRGIAIAAGTVGASVALGVPYALLVTRSDLPGRSFLRACVVLPFFLPTYVFALGWQGFCDPQGLLARGLAMVGLPGSWVPDLATPMGCVVVLALRFFPLVVLLAAAGLDRVDPAGEEAARLVHGPLRVLARITLPLARPQIAAAALLIFNLALVNYTVPSLLQVHTFPVEIFAAFSGLFDTAGAVALALPLMAVSALAVVLARLAIGRRPFVVTPAPGHREAWWRLGWGRPPAAAAALALVTVTVGVPILALASRLGGAAELVEAYRLASEQFWRTILLATAAATVLGVWAIGAGHLVARGRRASARAAELCFLLPLAIPPTVLGIGMIRTWNRPAFAGLMESPAILVVAYVAELLPFAVAASASAMVGVEPRLEEAGLLAGWSWWARMRRIVLPASWPALLAGWLVVFAFAIDEVGASILVQPPDAENLAIRIYNLTHYDAQETVSALCLLVLAIVAVPLMGGALVLRLRRLQTARWER